MNVSGTGAGLTLRLRNMAGDNGKSSNGSSDIYPNESCSLSMPLLAIAFRTLPWISYIVYFYGGDFSLTKKSACFFTAFHVMLT